MVVLPRERVLRHTRRALGEEHGSQEETLELKGNVCNKGVGEGAHTRIVRTAQDAKSASGRLVVRSAAGGVARDPVQNEGDDRTKLRRIRE